MRLPSIHVFFLGLLHLSGAQDSQDSDNPLTVPACSTMLSIVDSCEYKLVDANTITASVFSCICFDSSGNYKPAAYDNAVAGCSSAYPDDSTDFGFWLPGFCTNTNYATETAAASSTMAGASATAVVGLTSSPTVNAIGKSGLSSTPTSSPGGLPNTMTSNPTLITPAPTNTGAQSFSHVSSTVPSTVSKADGMKIEHSFRDVSFLSIFGCFLSAFLIF